MMSGCTDIRELLGLYLDGELGEERVITVRDHLAECDDCAGILETLESIVDAGSTLDELDPPEHLLTDLASSPCTRWLGLLHQAVDHEISQHNLERLLTHLEACPSCRRAWQDLTLIRQVSEAMQPSQYLLKRCIAARERPPRTRPMLNRRMATAAAYILAVLTSLVIGNPVTLARSGATEAVGRVAEVVSSEVSDVAEQGRGEARIMLWRLWKWGESKIEAVRELVGRDDAEADTDAESQNEDSGADQGEN